MVVGIDYTSAATQQAGIGRVTRELVRAMLELPQRPELRLLYAHRGPIRAADALAIGDAVQFEPDPGHPEQDPLSHGGRVLSDATREDDGGRAS